LKEIPPIVVVPLVADDAVVVADADVVESVVVVEVDVAVVDIKDGSEIKQK
jgi:hypothetical protein